MPLPNAARDDSNQRFLMFAMLAMGILLIFQTLNPPAPKADKDKKDLASAVEKKGADKPAAAEAAKPAEKPAPKAIPDLPAVEPAKFAIGSVDPQGPYRMMLTVSNEGAAVERVELSSTKFRDQHDRSGYLGHLDLSAEAGAGVTIGAVPPGTPAASAGLEPGDIISAAGVKKLEPVATPAEFAKLLAKTKPRQTLQLDVTRGGRALGKPLEAKLLRRPLDVIRPEEENVRLHSDNLPEGFAPRRSLSVSLKSVGEFGPESPEILAANELLETGAWSSEESQAADSLAFRQVLPALELEVIKRYRLTKVTPEQQADPQHPSYHFDLELELVNLADAAQPVVYELEGPNGLPIEGWWYATKIGRNPKGGGSWSGVGLRDVIARFANGPISQVSCSSIASGAAEPMGQGAPLAYIGVDAQYFAAAVIPKKKLAEVWFTSAEPHLATAKLPTADGAILPTYNNASFTLTREPIELAAGAKHADAFTIFAGPKRPALLANYHAPDDKNYNLSNFLYYGWFGIVAKAMLGILHFFYAIVRNYGVAIVLLTVMVRGAMYPMSRKQTLNMQKMQELKPEMDRIAEKYKDDMQKRGQAQNELFRKHNYHPMAGCLPALIQLPIFLGLYRALAVDVELRQAPLIGDAIRWCSNLAAPDMLADWSHWLPKWVDNGVGMFGLGPYFNILPIVTLLLFLLQQKLFMPPPANEQMELQQKMMKYMMIFMGLMFFKVPSGLCVYFIASSLWGIAEKKLLPQPKLAPASATNSSLVPTNDGPKPEGFLSKIEKMAEHSRTAKKLPKKRRRN